MVYDHARYAGNHGDVLKHISLMLFVQALGSMNSPVRFIDTHAGAGRYRLDIHHSEARYRNGVNKIYLTDAGPESVAPYIEQLRGDNHAELMWLPGSPLLISRFMRDIDRLSCYEIEQQSYTQLLSIMTNDSRVQVQRRDGYTLDSQLLLDQAFHPAILIDPPYIDPDEAACVTQLVSRILDLRDDASLLIWQPCYSGIHPPSFNPVEPGWGALEISHYILQDVQDTPYGSMNGSMISLVNPPPHLQTSLCILLPWLVEVLGQSARCTYNIIDG